MPSAPLLMRRIIDHLTRVVNGIYENFYNLNCKFTIDMQILIAILQDFDGRSFIFA